MSGDIEEHVDTNSSEFKQGVEAGLNTGEEEGKDDEPVSISLFKESSTPLFISDSPEGNKGNPQDEKDETEE